MTGHSQSSTRGFWSKSRVFVRKHFRVGNSTSYASFNSTGILTLAGSARVWKNVDLVPANVGKPSSNPPAADEYQGFQFDRYDRETEEQVYFLWHIPEDFAVGSASVKGHFGFMIANPPAGVDEAVALGFEYKKLTPGIAFDFSSGTASGVLVETITKAEDAYIFHESATGICTTTGWTHGDIIMFRFYRDATNGLDTYDSESTAADNDVWIGMYHLEYLIDRLGAEHD